MAVSAKITFSITDPNGRSDGVAGANDSSKIEILKREGPASAGGSFALIETIQGSDLQPGQHTYTVEDTDILLKTPYFYVAKFYRGSDFVESDEIGPIFISGLHELGYPGNIPSNTDGVPNFISVAPLLHINAEYEYNFYGQVEGRAYQSGETVTNQNDLYPGLGWNTSTAWTVQTTSLGIPYINCYTGPYGPSLAVNSAGAFSSLKSNLGVDSDAQIIAMDEGLTMVMVVTYQELQGTKRIFQDQYSSPYWKGLDTQTLPTEWNVSGGLPSNFDYSSTNKYHPRKVSDGGFYEPSNIGNYFGPPNGVYWPEARGYWGHKDGAIGSCTQSANYRYPQAIGGISAWSRGDYQHVYDNQIKPIISTSNVYPTGSDTNKVSTVILRQKEDGSGTQTYVNGNLFHGAEHHQFIAAENANGHNNYFVSGVPTSGEPTWWSANNHTTDFSYLHIGHSPSTQSTPMEGYRYHIPAFINSAGFGQMWSTNWDGRIGICEVMVIPSSLTNQDFRRLTTYLANKYEDNMLPQGDYSL
jgi:hypothetical protein